MRAKFRVHSVTPPTVEVDPSQPTSPPQTVQMYPVSKSTAYPADGSDEDNTFAKWSPSGSLSLSIVNPALANAFKEGDTFYLDFTPVPQS